MRCPRCDGPLSTYSLDDSGDAAVVCESCGFAGVPASHHSDGTAPESWDAALERLDGETLLERSRQTSRGAGVSLPDEATGDRTTIDTDRLKDASVSVGASISEATSESEENGTDDHASESDAQRDTEESSSEQSE